MDKNTNLRIDSFGNISLDMAAILAGVPEETLRKSIESGKIPHSVAGEMGEVRIPFSAADSYIDNRSSRDPFLAKAAGRLCCIVPLKLSVRARDGVRHIGDYAVSALCFAQGGTERSPNAYLILTTQSERDSEPQMSITNAAEEIFDAATLALRKMGLPANDRNTVMVERWLDENGDLRLDLVQFMETSAAGVHHNPTWTPLNLSDYALLRRGERLPMQASVARFARRGGLIRLDDEPSRASGIGQFGSGEPFVSDDLRDSR